MYSINNSVAVFGRQLRARSITDIYIRPRSNSAIHLNTVARERALFPNKFTILALISIQTNFLYKYFITA